MTRSMSRAKQADVPAIYPLTVEHKKAEHVKPKEVNSKTGNEQDVHEQTKNIEPVGLPEMEELTEIPQVHEQEVGASTSLQHIAEIYQLPVVDRQVRRPNPLLEPSSYLQVMAKQLPKYGGMLKPQPIEN